MSSFSYEIHNDGIAILTFDLPGEKVNKLTTQVMDELDQVLGELHAKTDIKAMVVQSGKAGNFIVGADISEIRSITDSTRGEALARRGQSVLAKLESLPFPTVAAIHGPCMGGGLELALACTYRLISNDQRTALALPEVKLGIMPGFGGTQRLPRLVGLTNALDMILTGKSVFPKKARRMGLADEVTWPETLAARALAFAKQAAARPAPRGVRARRPLPLSLLEATPLTPQVIVRTARARVLKETRGNYPAPLAALDAVAFGLSHDRKAGYDREAILLGSLIPTEVSKNLISVFYLNELLKKGGRSSPSSLSHAAVLGAGVMGGGIAQLLAEKGLQVRMKDINSRAVSAGLKESWSIFRKRQQKGILTPLQERDGFDRITTATEYTGFAGTEIAIEAVVENLDVKRAVLRDFERAAGPDPIFASNTSSLSITALAEAAQRPERVVGMHFFNPVEKMPLVEIVRGSRTTEETVAAVASLSRRLGKLPVVVRDGPGFLVNRILMPYIGEAVAMLEQGGRIESIDEALLGFGMPMGAFILLDEVGIDIAHKVSLILHQGLGERARPSGLLERLYKEGYLGAKNGKGFYRYRGKSRDNPDPFVYSIVSPGRAAAPLTREEMTERPVLLMIKEAALCLEEGIIERPDLLDAALIFGIGFPPFRGGLLRHADRLGAGSILDKLETYAHRFGERFAPPASLREFAAHGKGFYA